MLAILRSILRNSEPRAGITMTPILLSVNPVTLFEQIFRRRILALRVLTQCSLMGSFEMFDISLNIALL